MTVSNLKSDKIKISLTNIEVLCCFGSYERLFTMSKSIKNSIKAILLDTLSKENVYKFQKLKVDVKAKKNSGCIIIVTFPKNHIKKEYIFDFANGENLTKAILFLYKNKNCKNICSTLYKMPDFFRLVIYSHYKPAFFQLNEFCFRKSENPIEQAYSEEYGKILIKDNAISVFAQYFKDS